MIWLNPWAWLGAAFVALPVVIHLLSRGNTRVERFPSLRFLDASRLLPTRRTRLTDVPLLIVRLAILVVAAAALAQPVLLTAGRRNALDRGIARVLIVDTSASMQPGIVAARQRADSFVKSAEVGVVVETANPFRAIEGAVAWLQQRALPAEIIIVSDFQVGALDSADLAIVPRNIGIRTSRVVTSRSDSVVVPSIQDRATIRATATRVGDATEVSWIRESTTSAAASVTLLGAPADADLLDATTRAAATLAVPLPVDSTRRIAIVFGKSPLQATSHAIAPGSWMQAAGDALLSAHPVITNMRADSTGRLLVFTTARPGSVEAAHLVADASRTRSTAPAASELEPDAVSDAELQRWNRAPSARRTSDAVRDRRNGPSDARWLWALVLALIALETMMRRSPRAAAAASQTDEARRAA